MAETPLPDTASVFTLMQAAQRLGMATRPLANMARQHGFFIAVGRDLAFSEAHLKALRSMIKERARAEERAAAARKKPKSTFGMNESAELRKQRRRTKKRQTQKDTATPD